MSKLEDGKRLAEAMDASDFCGPWCYENCGEKDNSWVVGIAYVGNTEEQIDGLIPSYVASEVHQAVAFDVPTGELCAYLAHHNPTWLLKLYAVAEAAERVATVFGRELDGEASDDLRDALAALNQP